MFPNLSKSSLIGTTTITRHIYTNVAFLNTAMEVCYISEDKKKLQEDDKEINDTFIDRLAT